MDTGLGKSSFVAVIGAANMDLMGKMTGPAVEGDSNPGELTVSAGGVARNIAENLAHLGTPCELITALGNDAWGQQLRQHCDSLGIGLSRSIVSDEHRTSTYLSTHDNQGELITAINDMAILDCLSAKNLESRIELLKAANCWVIDANLPDSTLAFLFKHVGDIPVWIDPVSTTKAARLTPYLSQISGITPNLEEAAILSGLEANGSDVAPILAKQLHAKGVAKVMITLGEHGAYTSNGEVADWVPAKQIDVSNVTGCGDAAIAALVHGYVSGVDWQRSCELAMAAAALTASSPTTNTPLLATLGHTQ